MAALDPEELDIDELVDKDDEDDFRTRQFRTAADHFAKKLLQEGIDDSKLLTLYGYYKQATDGPCNFPKPSFFDFKGRAKWEAWKQLGNLSKDEAKSMYIEMILKIDPSFVVSEEPEEKEHWIRVSTMMKHDKDSNSNEVTLIDFIKEGNLEQVEASFDNFEPGKSKNIIDKLDEVGLASIHWAADRGHVNIIELLLKNGANIDLQDVDGQTPLHYAASCGHLNCVKFLLKKGARKDILDIEGKDPYNSATDNEIKDLLCSS